MGIITIYEQQNKLSDDLVSQRCEELWLIVFGANNMPCTRSDGKALESRNWLTRDLRRFLLLVINLDTIQEVLSAGGRLHVLHSDVDTLGNYSSSEMCEAFISPKQKQDLIVKERLHYVGKF